MRKSTTTFEQNCQLKTRNQIKIRIRMLFFPTFLLDIALNTPILNWIRFNFRCQQKIVKSVENQAHLSKFKKTDRAHGIHCYMPVIGKYLKEILNIFARFLCQIWYSRYMTHAYASHGVVHGVYVHASCVTPRLLSEKQALAVLAHQIDVCFNVPFSTLFTHALWVATPHMKWQSTYICAIAIKHHLFNPIRYQENRASITKTGAVIATLVACHQKESRTKTSIGRFYHEYAIYLQYTNIHVVGVCICVFVPFWAHVQVHTFVQ